MSLLRLPSNSGKLKCCSYHQTVDHEISSKAPRYVSLVLSFYMDKNYLDCFWVLCSIFALAIGLCWLGISSWLWKDPENTHGVHRKQSKNCNCFGSHLYFGFVHAAKQNHLLNHFKLGFLTSAYIGLCLKRVAFDSVSTVFVSTIWIFQAAKQNNLFWLCLLDCLVKYYTFLMSE